jgi:hypothetical protein
VSVTHDTDGIPDGSCRHSAVAILIATALTLIPIGVGRAGASGPEYSARPASDATSGEPEGYFSYAVETGGGELVDAVEIMNFSQDPSLFDVYAADMVPTTNGRLAPASRDAEVVDTGAWITPNTPTIEVAGRSSALVEFTIDAPVGTAPGEYVAALLVERQGSGGTGTIETKTRIGLRVEIEVLGEVDLGLTLGDLDWERVRGDITFSLPFTNTGNVTFEGGGIISVTNAQGKLIADLSMEPATLFLGPGQTTELTAEWLDAPLFGKFEAQATVTAVVGPRDPVDFFSEKVNFWLIPWTEIVTVLALIGLIVWFLYTTRLRRKRWARHRREERAILRDYRERRRLEEQASADRAHKHLA